MELDGAKQSFSNLNKDGIPIKVFISDRHRGIAKWIRECQPLTKHFYDIWHVARSIHKKLLKASKEKGCEILKLWMKGIRNHLYWCATSTKEGFEDMIIAKWRSFLRHVANKHKDHPNTLIKKCAHDEIRCRDWIKIGMYYMWHISFHFEGYKLISILT
jgi:solute carrier family 8 (sodium/calcium exchanger)